VTSRAWPRQAVPARPVPARGPRKLVSRAGRFVLLAARRAAGPGPAAAAPPARAGAAPRRARCPAPAPAPSGPGGTRASASACRPHRYRREHQKPPQPLAEADTPATQARQLPGNLRGPAPARRRASIRPSSATSRSSLQPGALPGPEPPTSATSASARPRHNPQRLPEPGGRGPPPRRAPAPPRPRLVSRSNRPRGPADQVPPPGRKPPPRPVSAASGPASVPQAGTDETAASRPAPRRLRGPPTDPRPAASARDHPSPPPTSSKREHRAPSRAAQRKLPAIPDRLHRPQNAELEPRVSRPAGRSSSSFSHASIVSHPEPAVTTRQPPRAPADGGRAGQRRQPPPGQETPLTSTSSEPNCPQDNRPAQAHQNRVICVPVTRSGHLTSKPCRFRRFVSESRCFLRHALYSARA